MFSLHPPTPPIYYSCLHSLVCTPDFNKFTFAGVVDVTLRVNDATSSITFHTFEIEISLATVKTADKVQFTWLSSMILTNFLTNPATQLIGGGFQWRVVQRFQAYMHRRSL